MAGPTRVINSGGEFGVRTLEGTMLQLDGYRYRLDAAIDPETNDIRQYRLCSTITTAPTGRFLHERTADHEFDDAVFLARVQFVSRLYTTDTGLRLRYADRGNRCAIEPIICNIERVIYSFSKYFGRGQLPTGEP